MKGIRDKKLRGSLKTLENKYRDATIKAKDAEILLENTSGFLEPENELERTFKVYSSALSVPFFSSCYVGLEACGHIQGSECVAS